MAGITQALLSDEVRKASVRATSAVKCWTLDKATFIMHIPSHLFENEHVISIREGLRTAPGVTGVIDRYWGVFWDTLEDASRPTWSPQRQNNAKILREQYVQLHTRLNKALSQAFAEQVRAAHQTHAQDETHAQDAHAQSCARTKMRTHKMRT